jgi:ATP-dependent DNA helicase DinG
VLDEAHQLPEVASHFFGLSLSSRQLTELARDTAAEQLRNAPDFKVLAEYARHFEKAVTSLRLALGEEPHRASWYRVIQRSQVSDAGEALRKSLYALQRALKEAAIRGKGLENCYKRSENLVERLTMLLAEEFEGDGIHWFETRTHSFTVNFTPLEIASSFSHCLNKYQGVWIFTSATLTVADSFEHFTSRLGLNKPKTLRLDSPFDFSQHAILYHPRGLPEPASPYYTKALVDVVLPVLQASRARAFLLFTSYRALQEAAAALRGRLDYPILQQGSLPKGELLSRFQALGNAVLLGTASFWEGVDVRGDALSCVVIDKLPFASPGDPVLKGRIEAMRRRGEDPFMKYQLPHAVLTLKQGVGRLIRDVHDRGVLMLCDPRLFSKSYGQVFLASLPPMARTHELEQVKLFFAS